MANSPGWMEKPATRIQIFAPFTSLNRPGRIAGRARKARPAAASVYAYRASARWSRTTSRTATNRASPMQVHSTWDLGVAGRDRLTVLLGVGAASARSSRRISTRPSPLSRATAGRISGSAYGASQRTATCATA